MAFRESCVKRRFADLRGLLGGARTIALSHVLHLAKDDRLIAGAGGVGRGAGLVSSLGHHLTQDLGLKSVAIWMIYGAGEDSQPFPGLPRRTHYPNDTLNTQLAGLTTPILFRVADLPGELSHQSVSIGHIYDAVFRTSLDSEVDAIIYFPSVSPMRKA